MRHFAMGCLIALGIFGCSKKTTTPPAEILLPETITGTIKSLSIDYIDMTDPTPRGLIEITASDGKQYNFQFGEAGDFSLNANNCAITLDTTNILPSNAPFSDTAGGFIVFKNAYLPNSFNIVFNGDAEETDTKGAKEIHAAFTNETAIYLGFFNYSNKDKYAADRKLSIDKVNQVMGIIRDAKPDPGNQPAKMYCEYRQ